MAVRFGASVSADIVARDEHGNITGERHSPKNLFVDFTIETKAKIIAEQAKE
jgi:hypothetical protein